MYTDIKDILNTLPYYQKSANLSQLEYLCQADIFSYPYPFISQSIALFFDIHLQILVHPPVLRWIPIGFPLLVQPDQMDHFVPKIDGNNDAGLSAFFIINILHFHFSLNL